MTEVIDMQPEDAIRHPAFSHARSGDGLWRDVRWIYHFDSESPSGFHLVSSGDKSVVEPMLRELRRPGALSPDEPR